MRPDGAAAAGPAGVAVAAHMIDAIARIYVDSVVSKVAVMLEGRRGTKDYRGKSLHIGAFVKSIKDGWMDE